MNERLRAVVTVTLMAFVTVSAAYLVWDGTRGRGAAPEDSAGTCRRPALAAGERTVLVYYFHGNTRCWTCRTIETYTKEAVESAFAPELETGEVEVRVVNVEDPENRHFVDDYELATRSVVLVDVVGGEEQRWQRLDDVWRLVGDKAAFMDYVVGNARGFLDGSS